jgi:hypothetical protein
MMTAHMHSCEGDNGEPCPDGKRVACWGAIVHTTHCPACFNRAANRAAGRGGARDG